jgi:hypothetical protein
MEHPTRKLGRRPPSNKPALRLADFATGQVPAHPGAADHFANVTFGLYGNDKYGDCGPTSVANLVRLVSKGLTGTQVSPSQDDVFDLYRRSGNPNFDPATDADDNGVDMQTMLEALLAGGIGDGKGGTIRPVAFAKVDASSDAELDAAVSIFGGVLWGVDLQVAQQAQTDAHPPKWDYHKSGEWGGHAILDGRYDESKGIDDVISWGLDVQVTQAFREHQLEEAWVVVWEWNLGDQAFQEGVDIQALEQAYEDLTGEKLPVPSPTPTPTPTPAPSDPADADDRALWAAVRHWAVDERHTGDNKRAATAVKAWAATKGLT